MGHLCSCHRHNKFDNGAGGSTWKTDAGLLHKLRLRCRYLGGAGIATSTRRTVCVPPQDEDNKQPRPPSWQEGYPTEDRTISASSPSSPLLTRAAASAPPKPPRTRSMQVNGDVVDRKPLDRTSELDICGMPVTLSLAGSALDGVASSRGGPRPHTTMGALLRHTCDLLVTSGVRPELLADFLRRRDVVGDETASAVRRCHSRRAACELLAEVVASKAEVAALCDALKSTGCGDVSDCLAAVDLLLRLQQSESLTAPPINDRSFQDKSRDSWTNVGEDQTGSSRLQCSVNVDVIYIDPSTGGTLDGDDEDDATSATRAKRLKHRSLFIDPETTSLPLQVAGDRAVGLPVASVTFHGVCLPDRLADRLADILLGHRSFRILTFVKCRRVDACLFRIGRRLAEQHSSGGQLSRLHVRLSQIDDANVVGKLVGVLTQSLRSLSLTGCSIMSTGCATIVRNLVTGSRRLAELDLGFNDVADVEALSDALATNCSLRCLRLRGNAIGCVGASSLFGSLRRNYRLELLDVSGNPIGESAGGELWCAVAEALLSNRTLRELKLERCSLGVDASSALGRVLAVNTTLRVLDLSMNPSVGNVGAALLADGLRRNRRSEIHTLALNMCAVGNAGFRSLLVAVKDGGATTLRHVKLCYNSIGSEVQPQVSWRRRGPGSIDSRKGSLVRPRPASTHFDLSLHEASHFLPVLDHPRSGTAVPRCDAEVPPSEAASRDVLTADRCPEFRITPHSLLNEAANPLMTQHSPIMASNCASNDAESAVATTSQTMFNKSDHRSALHSTPNSDHQSSIDVNPVWNGELSTPTNLPGAERRSTLNVEGLSPMRHNFSQLPISSTDEDEDIKEDIYVLLCRVLRANPHLKVLLWGNQHWGAGGKTPSKTTQLDDDISVPTVSSSTVSCLTNETTSNRLADSGALYATLPRNYHFR